MLRRCVTREEAQSILWHYHNSPYGGHYSGDRTAAREYIRLDFSVHPYSEMLMTMYFIVINAKEQGNFKEEQDVVAEHHRVRGLRLLGN